MIRIEITPTDRVGGYSVFVLGEVGREPLRLERTLYPLLDACRELKRMGVDPCRRVGLFRKGVEDPALSSTVGYAAGLRVVENEPIGSRFRKYKPMTDAARSELHD